MAEHPRARNSSAEQSLHRWAVALVVCTFVLIMAGGLVTSRDAGLAVPDWPLSFGTLNPPHWYEIENVRTEHGHRLIAGFVALLTAAVALRARRLRARQMTRRIAYAALGAVLLQALLGGLRVLHLSIDLAMLHGWLAQMFLCLVVSLAVVTSPRWRESQGETVGRLPLLAATTSALIVIQLVVGVVIRHGGADARPLSTNTLFYFHLAGAALIFLAALAMSSLARDRAVPAYLASRTRLLVALVLGQALIGVAAWAATEAASADRSATVLESWVPTLHVGVGAGVLACSVAIALHSLAGRGHRTNDLAARPVGAH